MESKTRTLFVICLVISAAILGGIATFTDSVKVQGLAVLEKRHNLFFEYESVKYPATIRVDAYTGDMTIGFNIETAQLDFGIAVTGESINRKFINISNTLESESRIHLEKQGNISSIINFSRNDFMLSPGETQTVSIYAKPVNAPAGIYSGYVEITYTRARHPLISIFL